MTQQHKSERPFSIMIVEDDELIALDIESMLTDWGYKVCAIAANAADALKQIKAHVPDLLIADIQIDGDVDGVELVKKINKSYAFPVVFLTGQADPATVSRATATLPAAYLLKPFSEQSLQISIDLALKKYALSTGQAQTKQVSATALPTKLNADIILKKGEEVFIKQNYKFVRQPITGIIYLEADRNHTTIYTQTQKLVVRMALANVLERLNEPHIVRVHRSFAINTQLVNSFDDDEIEVGNKTIPLSSTYRTDFLNQFNVV